MLGKGLESLIPPQGDDTQTPPLGDNQGPGVNSVVVPQIEKVGELSVPLPVRPLTKLVAEDRRSKIPAQEAIYHIEVAKIKPNPTQPRRNFNEEGLRELAGSIREFGFIQPLVVSKREVETPTGVDVEYQLITGERRLLAAKMLGLTAVPAVVRNVSLEREKLELAVIENIQRENLSPIEMARAFEQLKEEFKLTQREIAAKLSKSRGVVANTMRLLDLPLSIQEALEKGQISESHGRLLLAIPDPSAQQKLFNDLLSNQMTTRELKRRVETHRQKRQPSEDLSPELKMIQERLSVELGAPVSIEPKDGAKKLIITLYSDEELQNIVRRLSGGGEESH